MESSSEGSAAPSAPRQSAATVPALQRIRLPLWLFLLMLLALLGMFGWSQYQANAADHRLAEERQAMAQAMETERAALQTAAADAVTRQTVELETLFGAALAWSVRSSMLRNNLDEIDQYFGDLVKNPRITLVLLAGPDGKVLRSTDRRYLDTDFATSFPPALLTGSDVSVHPDEGRRKRIVLPVQGLTSRLGTVMLVYLPQE